MDSSYLIWFAIFTYFCLFIFFNVYWVLNIYNVCASLRAELRGFLHGFTPWMEVQHSFNLVSHPSFFLSQLSPPSSQRNCGLLATAWPRAVPGNSAQGTDLSPGRVTKLPLEVSARSREVTRQGRETATPLALPATGDHMPCLILGWQGPLPSLLFLHRLGNWGLERAGICRRSWWCRAEAGWMVRSYMEAGWMVCSYSSASCCRLSHSLSPGGLVVEFGHSHPSFHDTLDIFFFWEILTFCERWHI